MTARALTAWIDNNRVPVEKQKPVIELLSPWSGLPVGTYQPASAQTMDLAITTARRAFLEHRFKPTYQRIEWLEAAASEIENVSDHLVTSEIDFIGKPRRAAKFEIMRSAQFIRACAKQLSDFSGETISLDVAKAGTDLFGYTERNPYGVIVAVTPFNAPANLLLQKVAPALAVGNSVVVKPSPEGLEVALIIAQCFATAGLPAGLFNIVPGGADEALFLAAHRDVSYVTFTGGTIAGRALATAAGGKPFVGELGGNSANIICADAALGDAVARIVPAAFEASGQQCISAQRIIVEQQVLDKFLEPFTHLAQQLNVGDPSLETTDLGPVVHVRSADRIMEMIGDAEKSGAKIVLAPSRNGCVISPTIILSENENLRIVKEEVFGPVVVVIPARDVDHAIDLANATEFGLQATCFTRSLDTAFRMSKELDVGSVWINEGSRFRLDNYPFGGVRSSGFGREGVRFAMEAFTQWKFTGIRFPDRSAH